MALTKSQQDRLINALKGYDHPALSILLNQVDEAPPLVEIVGQNAGRTEVAVAVQQEAADGHWEEMLVDAGYDDKQIDPDWSELKQQLSAARQSANGSGNGFGVDLMGLRPFIMRDVLRKYLRALEGATRSVLVVRGEPHSGKSYTKDFVIHLSKTRTFEPYLIELANDRGNEPRKQVSARDIVHQFTLAFKDLGDPPPALMTKFVDQKWADAAEQAALWLRGRLQDENKARWIILDGFNHCDLIEGAEDLVDELAVRVTSDLTSVRLILLGYDGPLRAGAFEDDIDEPSVAHPAAKAVFSFLYDLHAEAGFAGTVDQLKDKAKTEARDVLAGVNQAPSAMAIIGPRLEKRAEEVLL